MKLGTAGEKLKSWLGKYKLALLVLALGVLFLAWPTGEDRDASPSSAPSGASAAVFDPEEVERKLERTLSKIDGAGEVTVALTVSDGVRQRYAVDETRSGEEEQTRTVVISTGSGTEEAVRAGEQWPAFQGALVVCQGGGDPEVRLLVTRAVCALTGLGADKVTVCKGGS